ncbi:hypothetical protein LUCX_271 [Xanthomonas phage vB_XciM_LucasX]|nr:hypothetical protein LUCX_271 [Xanthomonas phage vB_XciM_LucasX]
MSHNQIRDEMSNGFNQHLEHCDHCKDHPFSPCDTGSRAIHEAVENGTAGEYERTMDSELRKDGDWP